MSAFSLLIFITSSSGQNIEVNRKMKTINNSGIKIDTKPPDYLMRISSVIEDSKVPEFLSNVIPTKSSGHNISTDDFLTLYGMKTISFTEFKTILSSLNISTSSVFSEIVLENILTDFGINFNKFYANIMKDLQLTQKEKLKLLQTLGIDPKSFSFNLEFGDAFVDFKKGNVFKGDFLMALKSVNKTVIQIFDTCRKEIINAIVNKSIEQIFDALQKLGLDRSKLTFALRAFKVDSSKARKIKSIDKLLNDLVLEIENNSPLGVLVRYDKVITNRKIEDMFNNRPLNITVQHLYENSKDVVVIVQNTKLLDIVSLDFNKTAAPKDNNTYAITASTKEALKNCVFFSLDAKKSIVFEIPEKIENNGRFLRFNSTKFSSKVSVGSPLVCYNKVYGLAENVLEGVVTLQALIKIDTGERNVPNASTMMLQNNLFVFFFLLRYLIM